jgi:hypothetical protein
MTDKRQKIKGRRSGPTFGAKPHHIFRADTKNNQSSPASVLSHMAAHMLDNLVAQYNGINNSDLTAAPKIMKLYGWTSQGSVHSALTELLATGFIEQSHHFVTAIQTSVVIFLLFCCRYLDSFIDIYHGVSSFISCHQLVLEWMASNRSRT